MLADMSVGAALNPAPMLKEEDAMLAEMTVDAELNPEALLLAPRFAKCSVVEDRKRQFKMLHENIYKKDVADEPLNVCTEEENSALRFARADEPRNSYTEQEKILNGGFPDAFILGIHRVVTGPLDLATRRWLLHHFNRRPSRNAQLLFYLHDMLQRAKNGQEVKTLVQRQEGKWKEFYELVMNKEFVERLGRNNAVND